MEKEKEQEEEEVANHSDWEVARESNYDNTRCRKISRKRRQSAAGLESISFQRIREGKPLLIVYINQNSSVKL